MSKVFSTAVNVGPLRQGPESQQGFQKPYDPHRMPEAEKVVAPVNTRTFLFHADPTKDRNGEGIIIEGVGATDQERIADFKAKLADKLKLGYSTERQQHGTHPHSNDTARIERQTLAAQAGDKSSAEALAAKAARATPALDPTALKSENELLAERVAKLEAMLEAANAKKPKQ